MESVSQIQHQLNELFSNQFKNYSEDLNLSVPLIPRISQNYLLNRTIVLGQETNTWYRNDTDNGLKEIFLKNSNNIEEICLIERYDKFIRYEAEYYSGKFWDFTRLLYSEDKLKGRMVENCSLNHCWINLFTVEACRHKQDENGRPTKNRWLGSQIMTLQGDLLYKVLAILQPKLILAVTGNTLDNFLFSNVLVTDNYEITRVDPNGILEEKHLCEIKILSDNHPLAKTRILRSYHPTYFMGKINTYEALANKIKNHNYNSSVADYYTDIFIEAL